MTEELLEIKQRLDRLKGVKMALEKVLREKNAELVQRIVNIGMEIKDLEKIIEEGNHGGEEPEIPSEH